MRVIWFVLIVLLFTVYAAPGKTLLIMLAITPIVMPLMILYTVNIHRAFRK